MIGTPLPNEKWEEFHKWFNKTIPDFLKQNHLNYFEYGADSKELADMLFDDGVHGNISVDTVEAHRRKGLSAYLAMKTIEMTTQRGLQPIWDCTDDNIASENTAKKCGFYEIREDIIFWFDL